MDLTPILLAQNIVDDLYFLDRLDNDRIETLLGAIVSAIEEYGEKRYSDGFNDGYGASNEEMSA